MYRVLCCLNRNTPSAEADNITDSLERCLSVERGVNEFREFLLKSKLQEGQKTLAFVLSCQRILTDLSGLSPASAANDLPQNIQSDIRKLLEMADDINFDKTEMDRLKLVPEAPINKKIEILGEAQEWATNLLKQPYDVFRRETLRQGV